MKKPRRLFTELPDTPVEKKLHSREGKLRTRFHLFLQKEGFYKYAKLVLYLREMNPNFLESKYDMPKDRMLLMLNDIWGQSCLWSETVDSFLEKLRIKENSILKYIPKNATKTSKQNTRELR